MLALVGFGFGWFLSGQQIANLEEGQSSPSAISNTTAKPDASLPKADVPGENFSDLPRYPDSVRIEYQRRVSKAGLVVIDADYVASARLDDVRQFYRGVFRSEGWTVAGFDVSEGEWDFFLTKGDREALIDIESRGARGKLVETEIEVSEPQKETEVQKDSASPQRPKQAAPAPSTTPSSDGDVDSGDGSEGD
jgi:hypothetical protein